MRKCNWCKKEIERRNRQFCSRNCASRAKVYKQAMEKSVRRYKGLPDSGEAYAIDSEFYKIGHLGMVFRWGVDEWRKSSMTSSDLAQFGVKGRFERGSFIEAKKKAA